jgi:cytochrome b561
MFMAGGASCLPSGGWERHIVVGARGTRLAIIAGARRLSGTMPRQAARFEGEKGAVSHALPNRQKMSAPAGTYTRTAIALHWIAAILIVCNLALGISMINFALSPLKIRLYGWHKWIGITVFLTAAVRILWLFAHPAPTPVAMPAWQRSAARATHAALYVLMFAIPLSGWVYSSATGVSVIYLGLFPLPDLVGKDKVLAGVLWAVHATLNFILFVLVIVHVGAALRHQYVERDDTLRRMLPFARRNPAQVIR